MRGPFQNNPKLDPLRVSELETVIKQTGRYNDLFYNDHGFFIGSNNINGLKRHDKISIDGEVLLSSDQFRRISGREEDSSPNMTFSVLTGELDAYGGEICLCGIIDQDFNIIIPAIYDFLYWRVGNWLKVSTDHGIGAVNGLYHLAVPAVYTWIEMDPDTGNFLCQKESGCDLFDENGNLLLASDFTELNLCYSGKGYMAFKTDDIEALEDAYSCSAVDGKYGLLDTNGNEIIPCIYDMIREGHSLRNEVLVMVGDLRKDDLSFDPPNMHYASYTNATGGQWGVLNFNNEFIVPAMYEWIESTWNENCFLVNQGGIMNYSRWDHEDDLWEIIGGKWGMINNDNKVLVPIE